MWKERAKQAGVYALLTVTSPLLLSSPVESGKAAVSAAITRKVDQIKHSVATSFGYVRPLPAVPPKPDRTWEDYADDFARAHDLNRCLVRAMIEQESKGCTLLISKAGALGCMQLMPATARAYGVMNDAARLDPEQNIFAGVKHFAELKAKHGVFLALQIYNAGPSRVNMTPENRNYPHEVLAKWSACQDTVEKQQPYFTAGINNPKKKRMS